MKTVKIITDPEAFQLLADETRRKIIFLLRARPLSVSQIAQELSLSPQTVYHHIQKLKGADMVEVVKEERVGHLIESYYQSTAEVFNCYIGESPAGIEVAKKLVKTIVDTLNRLGFNLEYDDAKAQEIANAENKLSRFWDLGQLNEQVSKFDDVDFLSKQSVLDTAKMLSLSEEEFNERLAIERKIRELYVSMASQKKKK
jgi:DNA-binding transcriptional ArsR family regulator